MHTYTDTQTHTQALMNIQKKYGQVLDTHALKFND